MVDLMTKETVLSLSLTQLDMERSRWVMNGLSHPMLAVWQDQWQGQDEGTH